jgi:hypothetical protein
LRHFAVNHTYLFDHSPAFWAAVHIPLLQCAWCVGRLAELYVLFATLSFLVLRIKQPRPGWHKLCTQPGTAAVIAVVFGFV